MGQADRRFAEELASRRLLVHYPGRVIADLACAIADDAEVMSDSGPWTTRANYSAQSRRCRHADGC
jgi:hypothetical protein